MMPLHRSDLERRFYGGGDSAEVQFLRDAHAAGVTAADLLAAVRPIWLAEAHGVTAGSDVSSSLESLIDEVSAAGGGTIIFGEGTYWLGNTTLKIRPRVSLRGMGIGRTTLKRLDAAPWWLLRVERDADYVEISHMTLDGNRDNNEPGSASSLWWEPGSRYARPHDLEIINSAGYGMNFSCQLGEEDPPGTPTPDAYSSGHYGIHAYNLIGRRAGKDFIDMKNNPDFDEFWGDPSELVFENEFNVFENIWVEEWGMDDADSEAIVDVRGRAIVRNIYGRNPGTNDDRGAPPQDPPTLNCGVRLHLTDVGDITADDWTDNGIGGHYSTVDGVWIEGAAEAVQVLADHCSVTNVVGLRCERTIEVGSKATHNVISNAHAINNYGTEDFWDQGQYNTFRDCFGARGRYGAAVDTGSAFRFAATSVEARILGGRFSGHDLYVFNVLAGATGLYVSPEVDGTATSGLVSDAGTGTVIGARNRRPKMLGSDITYTSVTAPADIAALGVRVRAGTKARIRWMLHYNAAGDTDLKIRLDPPAGPTVTWCASGYAQTSPSINGEFRSQVFTGLNNHAFGGTGGSNILQGVVDATVDNTQVGASDVTITPMGAQQASTLNTTTLYSTSYVEVDEFV